MPIRVLVASSLVMAALSDPNNSCRTLNKHDTDCLSQDLVEIEMFAESAVFQDGLLEFGAGDRNRTCV